MPGQNQIGHLFISIVSLISKHIPAMIIIFSQNKKQ